VITNDRYLEVVYNAEDRPFTRYPDLLARHLVDKFSLVSGQTVLDVGCGRGEFLRGFVRCGLLGSGVDQSSIAEAICPLPTQIQTADLESEPLPFLDDTFDVVFSKSVIEHFYYPEKLVLEMKRVLRPGGIVITMCPDWEANYRIFFEDYTHRTPFTTTSLRDIQLIHGFEEVTSEKFVQLPSVWQHSYLMPISSAVRYMCPAALKRKSKFVRFSKEIMLLSSARKPHAA
jgi:SAM-dependent methyltransferase